MTPQPHRGMEHCKDASVVIKGDGVAWIKCDKVVGDCLWVIANGKCPNKSRPAHSAKSKALIFIPKPSTELILIAEQEWDKKQRQQHDKASWISGFLEGYFSKPVNIQLHDAAIAAKAREKLFEAIRAERDPSLDYVDWDSIEAAYIRTGGGEP